MIEFSQPNTHKAFHVGHVRGTSLGESIARINEFCGNKVLRANYSGDTGMHIAKWIWCYTKYHSKKELSDDERFLANIYSDAIGRLEKNENWQNEVEKINKKLDSRSDKELNKIWKETRKLSIKSWDKIYHELNTKFDIHFFESDVEKAGKKIAKELVKKNIAEISDGATIIDFVKAGKPNLGVLVLLRKDGTVLYGSKDLALAKRKFYDFKIDESIYVIGREQDMYIHQIFETLKLINKNKNKSIYVPVSEVRLPWGKMSSRTG
ncbi:arginine--tRNA ligase, partial [Candidatus Parvarchaeota archaeon]